MRLLRCIFRTICLSFSMYSRIPMPYIEYDENDMRYTFLCFPFIGVIIGTVEYGWYRLSELLGFGSVFYACVATVIPILITGGFHMDGFIDTMDALSSHREMSRKLEILKDSHVGAFAVIWTVVYFLISFGAYNEIAVQGTEAFILIATSFVVSRITSGLAAISFKSATGNHSLTHFSRAGDRKAVKFGLIIYIIAILVGLGVQNILYPVILSITVVLCFIYYYLMSRKQFGGITGDLAGWYLQVCELTCIVVCVIAKALKFI